MRCNGSVRKNRGLRLQRAPVHSEVHYLRRGVVLVDLVLDNMYSWKSSVFSRPNLRGGPQRIVVYLFFTWHAGSGKVKGEFRNSDAFSCFSNFPFSSTPHLYTQKTKQQYDDSPVCESLEGSQLMRQGCTTIRRQSWYLNPGSQIPGPLLLISIDTHQTVNDC